MRKTNAQLQIERVGETFTNKNGLTVKIIKYETSKKVTIQFLHSGEIRECQYGHLLRGAFDENKTTSRIGEVHKLNCGWSAKIIEYRDYKNVSIKILESNEIMAVRYDHLKNGEIIPTSYPTVYGVGYLGSDFDKTVDEDGVPIKCYKTWNHMMERGYSERIKNKYPTYKDVTVCKEWHNYSNFKKWFDENYYEIENEIMHLDKDILSKGNKAYSPETCVFVPQYINVIFTKKDANRGVLPIGVAKTSHGNKYEITLSCGGEKAYLGRFDTPEEAFNVYKQFKENYIKQVADEYKDKIPQKLYDAMYRYEVEITD